MSSSVKTVFSGIQPSGEVHIGNYLGAIRQWVSGQEGANNLICIVDLHAITVPQEPADLNAQTLKLAKLLLACGLEPSKVTLFKQSDVPAHSELGWILNCITYMGELTRMTQYKDKSQKGTTGTASVGLFDYPVLMAADILLYNTDYVPVGDDQKQHLELARDLATRFNQRFGVTFTLPEPKIEKSGARIMSLTDPTRKMSKSDSQASYIGLLDPAETIRRKVMRAVTDSGEQYHAAKQGPAIKNLTEIYALFAGISTAEVGKKFEGSRYGDFKAAVADLLVQELGIIQDRYEKITNEKALQVLKQGAETANTKATSKLAEVKNKVGLG